MANKLLFISSAVCGIINLLLLLLCQYYYRSVSNKECSKEIKIMDILTVIIIASSLLNHGNTSFYYKWLDRIMVYFGLIIYIYIGLKYYISISLVLIITACILYIFAKVYKIYEFHILVHTIMTINNIILYISLH
jgi:hypothetical protein